MARPKGTRKNGARINLALPARLRRRLDDRAWRQRVSRSEVARQALTAYLASDNGAGPRLTGAG